MCIIISNLCSSCDLQDYIKTDVQATIPSTASSIILFAIFCIFSLQQEFAPLFRWLSLKTSSSSSSPSKGSYTAISTLSLVTSVDTIKNLSKNLISSLDCSSSLRNAIQSITRKECFARLDYIERLSINDLSILFRYAADANLKDFQRENYLAQQNQIVRAVITAIDMAVKVSRGCLSEGTKILSATERSKGGIDALRFVAVTRVFSEWRSLRLVPKGHQRYAVGLSLAYRDLLRNLEKIERGVHEYLRHFQSLNQESCNPTTPIPSPTLRQLLQFELTTKLHNKLPYLTEKSSSSGLLWAKRQLHYQLATLSNSLEVPEYYATPKEAACEAYRTVYNDYHGWAVKQIFSQSFGGSPPLDKIWLSIRPPRDLPNIYGGYHNYKTNHSRLSGADCPPLDSKLSDITSASSHMSSSQLATEEDENKFLVACENIGHEISEKWEDLLRMFNCGKEEKKKRKGNLILSNESHFNLDKLNTSAMVGSLHNTGTDINDSNSVITSSTVSSIETFTSRDFNIKMIEQSKQDVECFVESISPMVADLGKLIDELNMNDPTKA